MESKSKCTGCSLYIRMYSPYIEYKDQIKSHVRRYVTQCPFNDNIVPILHKK